MGKGVTLVGDGIVEQSLNTRSEEFGHPKAVTADCNSYLVDPRPEFARKT
jgi:hypothetical protein